MWKFHSSADALQILNPPGTRVRFLTDDLAVRDGAIHDFVIRRFGISIRWTAHLENVDPPHGFTDVAVRSPFTTWRHRHEFIEHKGGCLLRDTVEYTPGFGPLGPLANALVISRVVDGLFAFRHKATLAFFETKNPRADTARGDSKPA